MPQPCAAQHSFDAGFLTAVAGCQLLVAADFRRETVLLADTQNAAPTMPTSGGRAVCCFSSWIADSLLLLFLLIVLYWLPGLPLLVWTGGDGGSVLQASPPLLLVPTFFVRLTMSPTVRPAVSSYTWQRQDQSAS
jgi:hypothetical protein